MMETLRELEPSEDLEDYLERIPIGFVDASRLLLGYAFAKLREQSLIVLPLVAFLILFQVFVLREKVAQAFGVTIGIALVILGLAFFMEGVRLGLIPLAERIGASLPEKVRLSVVLIFAFLLGAGVTLAEPAVGVIRSAGKFVSPELSPLLYFILKEKTFLLVLAIALGVGLASLFGILRVVKNWSFSSVVLPVTTIAVVLTFLALLNRVTLPLVGVAWDSGGVVVGPVTLPLVLSVTIGLALILGRADVGKAGFGVAGLAALFPVTTILSVGLIAYYGGFLKSSQAGASATVTQSADTSSTISYGTSLLSAWICALQVVPLIVFMLLVLIFLARARLYNRQEVYLGIVFVLIGVFILNAGILLGLSALGSQSGSLITKTFHPPDMALFPPKLGKLLTISFACVLGYVATICEPAFNTLALQVEEMTVGAIKRKLLIHIVSLGVGVGAGLGVVKLFLNLPLGYFIIPLYVLTGILSIYAGGEFASIAWDAGACTTGAITVPLIIALGLGLGNFLKAIEGFGIIALATVLPILSVLALGIYAKKLHAAHAHPLMEEEDS